MGWALRLAEFDFSVEHCPGSKIRHVDTLSINVNIVTTAQTIPKDEIQCEQLKDPFCKSLKVKPASARTEYFYDHDGVIYKRQRQGEPLLVVPKSLEREIVALNHEPIYAAHAGRKRTLDILKLHYWWPGMGQMVENFVRECELPAQETRERIQSTFRRG
jgi:hypothetical protein